MHLDPCCLYATQIDMHIAIEVPWAYAEHPALAGGAGCHQIRLESARDVFVQAQVHLIVAPEVISNAWVSNKKRAVGAEEAMHLLHGGVQIAMVGRRR